MTNHRGLWVRDVSIGVRVSIRVASGSSGRSHGVVDDLLDLVDLELP